jgi:hypothetical protein
MVQALTSISAKKWYLSLGLSGSVLVNYNRMIKDNPDISSRKRTQNDEKFHDEEKLTWQKMPSDFITLITWNIGHG